MFGGKPEIYGTTDKVETSHRRAIIPSLITARALRLGHEADLFVIADRGGRYLAGFCEHTDGEGDVCAHIVQNTLLFLKLLKGVYDCHVIEKDMRDV